MLLAESRLDATKGEVDDIYERDQFRPLNAIILSG